MKPKRDKIHFNPVYVVTERGRARMYESAAERAARLGAGQVVTGRPAAPLLRRRQQR